MHQSLPAKVHILIFVQCLILGEITTHTLVVALNKTDLLPGSGPEDPQWAAALQAASDKVTKVLSKTAFAGAPLVPLSAAPGGAGKSGASGEAAPAAVGDVGPFATQLLQSMPLPRRTALSKPFVFAFDHCFSIKGHGTVLTGTVVSGQARTGDTLQLPATGSSGKMKSAQVFRQSVSSVQQGDRAGICVPGVPADALERGVLCAPGAVRSASSIVALVRKVRYFKGAMPSQSKCHVSIGHNTVVGTVSFAGAVELAAAGVTSRNAHLVTAVPAGCTYAAQDALVGKRPGLVGKPSGGDDGAAWQWAVIQLDSPVLVPDAAVLIGSRLDADASSSSCRLAWFGRAVLHDTEAAGQDATSAFGQRLHVYRSKHREGVVDRVNKGGARGVTVIGKDLFHKETDLNTFSGMQLALQLCVPPADAPSAAGAAGASGASAAAAGASTAPGTSSHWAFVMGTLVGPFGKSGKFKAEFQSPVFLGDPRVPWSPTTATLSDTDAQSVLGGQGDWTPLVTPGLRIVLPFRKRLFVQGSEGGRKQMLQGPLASPQWEALQGGGLQGRGAAK